MYNLTDTIAAVSSPTADHRAIIRITGPETLDAVGRVFTPAVADKKAVVRGSVTIEPDLKVDAVLYLFFEPHSYTGQTLAELHIDTNTSVVEAMMSSLLAAGLRMAGPGEFTARAYLNGKIDLSQAEAVNEIVTTSNKFQLAAAQKVLGGRLAQTTSHLRDSLMDVLSLMEAGLDFSGEDVEFLTHPQGLERLNAIKDSLEQILSGSISYEAVLDLPAVGIAGAPNAGKSSLLNKLLGTDRSIVSAEPKTTRDVLTAVTTFEHCRAVLFDCAGLLEHPQGVLDELAQQAAAEGLQNATVVVFCVDVSKDDWQEDIAVRKLVKAKALIPVATKIDLLGKEALRHGVDGLSKIFGADFLPTSAVTGDGIENLRKAIDHKIIEAMSGAAKTPASQSAVAITARHRQAVTEAIDNVIEAINQWNIGTDEIAAMMLRAAYHSLGNIEAEHVDEKILDRIFSRFCIGK
jgi:tRNA modification GTPase